MSLAVLLDQYLTWEKDKTGYHRVLAPPTAEKLKVVHDVVAGITGFNAERGDQIVIESLPFENTLSAEPPPTESAPKGPGPQCAPAKLTVWNLSLDRQTLIVVGGAVAGVIVLLLLAAIILRRGKRKRGRGVQLPAELPPGGSAANMPAGVGAERQLESKLAERDALQQKLDTEALKALKVAPVITKTAEVMAKHLREKIKEESDISAQVLRTWIREEEEA